MNDLSNIAHEIALDMLDRHEDEAYKIIRLTDELSEAIRKKGITDESETRTIRNAVMQLLSPGRKVERTFS